MIPEEEVREAVDHLFRHRAGQMVSVLARRFGTEHIDRIEDSVQDAMMTALKRWPFGGVPENASAWLIQVAKNRVIDRLRRDGKSISFETEGIEEPVATGGIETRFEGEIAEDQLRMMFACCHHAIPADSQVALTLKIVSGFSVGEISRAYLAKDEAIAKMLTRAKQKLRTVDLGIPAGDALGSRLDAVLRVLYLMFNEGYSASAGEALIRRDLCHEAIRLVRIVLSHPSTSMPRVHALAALFCFQAARLPARADASGELVLLADQDRSLWDRPLIAAGLDHFRHSIGGDELTDYHVEAEIASLHALASDASSTDWPRMIRCYDELQARRFSPVVELNRIVAIGHTYGPERALVELRRLGEHYLMTSFNLFHITLGHFHAELGHRIEALRAYNRALDGTRNIAVRRFIERKIEQFSDLSSVQKS